MNTIRDISNNSKLNHFFGHQRQNVHGVSEKKFVFAF